LSRFYDAPLESLYREARAAAAAALRLAHGDAVLDVPCAARGRHLEQRCAGFERHDLPSKWQHGATLFLAAGDKPATR
jgi:hypothetical protein